MRLKRHRRIICRLSEVFMCIQIGAHGQEVCLQPKAAMAHNSSEALQVQEF